MFSAVATVGLKNFANDAHSTVSLLLTVGADKSKVLTLNQGWGQNDPARLTKLCKEIDPSRLIINVSGWNDMKSRDAISDYRYPVPLSVPHDGKAKWRFAYLNADAPTVPSALVKVAKFGAMNWNRAKLVCGISV